MSPRAVEAEFESRCGICGATIDVGERIVNIEDEWSHAECADDQGYDVEGDAQ